MNKLFNTILKYSEFTATVFLGVGLVLAVVGYFSDRDHRVKQFTIEYAKAYHESSLQEARNKIREEIRKIENIDRSMNNSTLADLLSKNASKNPNSDFAKSIFEISDYYNSLQNCISAEICDEMLVKKLHASEASSLRCLILPALKEISLSGGEQATTSGIIFLSEGTICND